jgi:pyroglutamyl-peptidase
MPRVLLTAFEPFGGEQINPSLEAVRRMVGGPSIDGVALTSVTLPVVYGEAVAALRGAVEELDPEIVIALGEAGGRFDVTPERIAINVDDAPMPDNGGNAPIDVRPVPDAPLAYLTGLPVKAIVAALRTAGIPASVSNTAGTYVCNHVFFGLMHLIATERPELRGGFIHVPYAHEQVLSRRDRPASLSLETITSAVRIAVETTVRTPVDVAVTAGAVA